MTTFEKVKISDVCVKIRDEMMNPQLAEGN